MGWVASTEGMNKQLFGLHVFFRPIVVWGESWRREVGVVQSLACDRWIQVKWGMIGRWVEMVTKTRGENETKGCQIGKKKSEM